AARVLYLRARTFIPKEVVAVTGLFTLYACWVAWRTVINGAADTNLLANSTLILVQVLPGAIFLGYAYARRRFSFYNLIEVLQVIIAVQALLVILTFVSWD